MDFIKNIYLANVSEDVWPFICTLDDKTRDTEVLLNDYLADRFISIFEPNSLFLTPKKPTVNYLNYADAILKNSPEICVPKKNNGQLCLDIMADDNLINKICEYKTVNLIPYSATKEFYELVDCLENRGVKVLLPLSPDFKNASVVEKYGSKTGIRNLIPEYMPKGEIFQNLDDAINYAKTILDTGKGIVFKTNKGHAGMGVVIVSPNSIIPMSIYNDKYWNKFPIVVEEFIETDKLIGGGFPNLEYQITADGKVKLLYSCGMLVTKEGQFLGIEMGKQVTPKNILLSIKKIGDKIGKKYSNFGYRGNFEFDFIAGIDGQIYVTESNIRQTGGTHVYCLCQKLLGDDFENYYVISNNFYELPKSNWNFDKIMSIFKPILYNDKTKSGIIITSENLLPLNFLSYVIIGRTKSETMGLVQQIKDLLS